MWLSRIGMKGKAYAVLSGKHQEKSSQVKPRSRLDNEIKMDHKGTLWEVVDKDTATEDTVKWSVSRQH